MNRSTYLKQPPVQKFIGWMIPLVIGKRPLQHSWKSPRYGSFSCRSLYDAFTQYEWGGKDFGGTEKLLAKFRSVLDNPDVEPGAFLQTATCVMEWGGITRYDRLSRLGCNASRELRENGKRLDPKYADTDRLSGFEYMGAGYSKIYSLMLDDFPIYDSRVACALTSLIHLFCTEARLENVPDALNLGVPVDRADSIDRNPYGFPNIQGAQYSTYARSNVKAAWLLGELANLGKFGALSKRHRVSALQAALFMIGYKPLV